MLRIPSTEVYTALSSIDGVKSVGKPNRNVFTEFPSLTYTVPLNQVTRDLDNEIASQNIEIVIDIWSDTSVGASDMLVLVEEKMRGLDYTLDFSGEVPNPTDDIYHISTRFRATNV